MTVKLKTVFHYCHSVFSISTFSIEKMIPNGHSLGVLRVFFETFKDIVTIFGLPNNLCISSLFLPKSGSRYMIITVYVIQQKWKWNFRFFLKKCSTLMNAQPHFRVLHWNSNTFPVKIIFWDKQCLWFYGQDSRAFTLIYIVPLWSFLLFSKWVYNNTVLFHLVTISR